MQRISNSINILSMLPSGMRINVDDVIPELVLLKMNIGECINLGGNPIILKSMNKYTGNLHHIYLSVKFDISGVLKNAYVWNIGGEYSIHGSTGQSKRRTSDWIHNLLRNIEGQIVCDIVNVNNIFHDHSDIYKIYTR